MSLIRVDATIERPKPKRKSDNDKDGKTKKKSNCLDRVRFTATPFFYLVHLISMVDLFASHQFINLWQHSSRAKVWESFPNDAVLLEMDFAENLSIIVQDEQQSGHWVHKQVSV